MLACVSCQWHLSNSGNDDGDGKVAIERYDRLERHFLTSLDIAALQQMKTEYPVQTRMLIENVLQLGRVDEPDITTRFLSFFQDSTLQVLMADVEAQYSDVSDLEDQLTTAFGRLSEMSPSLHLPSVYTQIGSLDQSIVVGEGMLGISLDKYLGTDYPVYLRYGYTDRQRAMMTREYIVPDCIGFFLLSVYPIGETESSDGHIARIQYVVNRVMGRKIFTDANVKAVEQAMARKPAATIDEILGSRE